MGLCTGNLLHIASTHAFSKIIWYKDGVPVKTVNATMSLNTTGVVYAAPPNFGGIDSGSLNPNSIAFDTDG
jgi:adenosine/AMP kinase